MAEPKSRRLSFMDGLVLAIAADEKTVTRRLLSPQPTEPILWYPSAEHKRGRAYDGEPHFIRGAAIDFAPMKPGDTLNVCEALIRLPGMASNEADVVGYRADRREWQHSEDFTPPEPWPWKVRVLPARYCPTWAVRYRRRIVSVTPERLSSVTDAEAVREGIARLEWEPTRECFLAGFRKMHGLADDADPWVWRIEWAPGDVVVQP